MKEIMKIKKLVNKLRKEVDEAREKRVKEIYDEYARAYSQRLDAPQVRQMLHQMCRLWVEIESLWTLVYFYWNVDDNGRKQYFYYLKQVKELITTWNLIMTRLGLTWTAVPYLEKGKRQVQSASEIAKMESKAKEIGERIRKDLRKKTSKRTSKGGRRQVKNGVPLLTVGREKKKEK